MTSKPSIYKPSCSNQTWLRVHVVCKENKNPRRPRHWVHRRHKSAYVRLLKRINPILRKSMFVDSKGHLNTLFIRQMTA